MTSLFSLPIRRIALLAMLLSLSGCGHKGQETAAPAAVQQPVPAANAQTNLSTNRPQKFSTAPPAHLTRGLPLPGTPPTTKPPRP